MANYVIIPYLLHMPYVEPPGILGRGIEVSSTGGFPHGGRRGYGEKPSGKEAQRAGGTGSQRLRAHRTASPSRVDRGTGRHGEGHGHEPQRVPPFRSQPPDGG